jgi:hypothetical protein
MTITASALIQWVSRTQPGWTGAGAAVGVEIASSVTSIDMIGLGGVLLRRPTAT